MSNLNVEDTFVCRWMISFVLISMSIRAVNDYLQKYEFTKITEAKMLERKQTLEMIATYLFKILVIDHDV